MQLIKYVKIRYPTGVFRINKGQKPCKFLKTLPNLAYGLEHLTKTK